MLPMLVYETTAAAPVAEIEALEPTPLKLPTLIDPLLVTDE